MTGAHRLVPERSQGFAAHLDEPTVLARAYAVEFLLARHSKHVYENDLYPYYQRDMAAGNLTRGEACSLLACTFYKIGEYRWFHNNDDVVNIAIGGVGRDGAGAVNDLSYDILEAVRRCNIPGPNLSARLYKWGAGRVC